MEPEDWPYRQIVLTAANRWGKSVLLAGVLIWVATFKHRLGLQYGTPDWFDAKYNAVNICPLNDLAYVVREKVGELLEDTAKEQIQRAGGRGHVSPQLQLLFQRNPDPGGKCPYLVRIENTEYLGFTTKHGASLEFRTTDDSAKALQGRKKYFVAYDEFTREKDPLTRLASDIKPRTMDTRGVLFLTGTPHLETESTAEEVWRQGDPLNPDRSPGIVSYNRPITDNPAVTPQMIEELLEGVPEYLRPQITEGKFVQSEEAFFNSQSIDIAQLNIPNKRRRIPGHAYIIGWDLAIAKAGDRSIGLVVDVSETPCKVVEYLELPKGTQHWEIVRIWDKQLAFYHNQRARTSAILVFDATGMGGQMFKAEASVLHPKPRGFDFAGRAQKKLSVLQSVRMLLDKKLIVFPKECVRLAFELKHYVLKDMNKETDAVMALALATHLVERSRGRLAGERLITKSLAA